MKNSEEKIKEFFSSEENIKKLMSNEEFMNKISDGVVDAKTYQSEFKKLGLNLTDEEADQAVEITNKLVTTPPEELKETSLENVTGGGRVIVKGSVFWGTFAALSVGGLASTAASIACYVKSKNMKKSGNTEKASKYKTISALLAGFSVAALELPVGLIISMGPSLTAKTFIREFNEPLIIFRNLET